MTQMNEPFITSCPYCGEPTELYPDESGGSHQRYVEDCPVCCRPWQVEVTRRPGDGWDVTLRTMDE
jgi:transposase-like protein